MIKFFRKKRKTLANENKSIKYMRYAFGEIVLVVIGILIVSKFKNNTKPLPSLEGIKGWVTKWKKLYHTILI